MIVPASDSSKRPLFKKIKKTYLSVEVYKINPKQLLDFGLLSKLNKQTKYIQRSTDIFMRVSDQALLFRRKDEQVKKQQIFVAVTKICEIVRRQKDEAHRFVGVFNPSSDIESWRVVPTLGSKQSVGMIRVDENDLFLMGNLKIVIKYIGSKYKLPRPKSSQVQSQKTINLCEQRCAICKKSDSKVLIICQCMQSFHVSCLSFLSKQKFLKIEERNKCTTFTITLKCTSCQRNFPEQLVGENAAMQYVYDYHTELKRIQQEAVVVENEMRVVFSIRGLATMNAEYRNKRVYLYAMFTQNQISIGRDVKSDVYIQEKSVSRNHAKIKYDQFRKLFFIHNLSRKFGTLKKLNRQDIQIENQTAFRLANQLLIFTKHETQI